MPSQPTALFLKCLLISLLLCSCKSRVVATQTFSTRQDTLILHTQKHKGPGLFGQSYVGDQFAKDTAQFGYSLVLPPDVESVLRAQLQVDWKQKPAGYVDIIAGFRNGQAIYIADENNNKNLTDDPVYTWKPIEWKNPTQLAHCTFTINNGTQMVNSESWLNIGLNPDGYMQIGRSENLTASFKLGANHYTIGLSDPFSPVIFTYSNRTQAAVIKANAHAKDSLNEGDKRAIDEYFNLGGSHYRFAGISNNGDRITLIKENNFNTITGLQPGMLAPQFTAINTNGATLNSAQNRDKYIIIANSCGCGGDAASAQAGADISRIYSPKALVLNMDTGKGINLGPNTIDMEDAANKAFYTQYRAWYCSRLCYVISPDGRVAGKFEITAWKKHLPQLIKL